MTTPDVPAERGRDELREKLRHLTRDPGPLGSAVCALLKAAEAELPLMVMPDQSRAIIALLAQREAPTAGDIDSLDADMEALYDQLCAEGREGDALIVERAAYAIEALEADRALRAAPQEAREPDGWTDSASADALRTGRVGGIAAVRSSAGMQGPVPVYLGGEPSGAEAVVREAAPFSDTAVARIIEAVEAHCGMGHGAWDMVAARDLVEGFAAALGADTRRIDALDNMLRRWQSWARLAVPHIPSAAPMVREQYDALLTDTAIVRAAHQRLTAPDTQTEGDDVE